MRLCLAFVFCLFSCLPYRGERRAEETWIVTDPAGKPLAALDVKLRVLEGNCMALSRALAGRIVEETVLRTDSVGRLHTEREGTWHLNPCIFRTDQGVCVRHCYTIDHPGFAPLNTCENEDSLDPSSGRIKLRSAPFPRWSTAMRSSFRSSCAGVPAVQKRARDTARYCECLERRLDGSLPEEKFLRMTDAEAEAMLPSLDSVCR